MQATIQSQDANERNAALLEFAGVASQMTGLQRELSSNAVAVRPNYSSQMDKSSRGRDAKQQ